MLDKISKVLHKIEAKGYKAYVVGGFVRDYYLGKISGDIDIATNAQPDVLKKIFANVNLDNEAYGSVTIKEAGYIFKITTFRQDFKYINNRKPKIKYVATLEEDLLRRDFTINSLCLDKELVIIDLLDGKKDIDNKIIRCIGDASIKIKEDSLRILRAVRLATTLNFELAKEVKDAIIKYKKLLQKLSYERKKEELDKIFKSNNVDYGIGLLLELKLESILELGNLKQAKVINEPIGIWSQVDTNECYFTNKEKKEIVKVKEILATSLDDYTLFQYDFKLIKIAGLIKGKDINSLKERYQKLPLKTKKELAISFNEIKLLIAKDNMRIKKIITEIERLVVNKKLNNNNEILKEYIIKHYR